MFVLTSVPPLQKHILIVHDDQVQSSLMVDLLNEHGFRLSTAFDANQGYAHAASLLPDMIILNKHPSSMDAFAVLRTLKAQALTAHIPVLCLISASEAHERLSATGETTVDYIATPFSSDALIERVHAHLRLLPQTQAASQDKPQGEYLLDGSGSPEQVLIRMAKKHLYSRLAEPVRLSELACTLGVTERHLSDAFRQCLGLTVFEFMRQERIRKAKRLLTQTSLSILAVAQEVGFSSAGNFSTTFRELVGVAPSIFRSKAPMESLTSMEGALHWDSSQYRR